jgi:hypothetical protein
VRDEEIDKAPQHIVRPKTPRDYERQASPGELIDSGEHPNGPSMLGAILDENVRPDMIAPVWDVDDANLEAVNLTRHAAIVSECCLRSASGYLELTGKGVNAPHLVCHPDWHQQRFPALSSRLQHYASYW